MIASEKRPDVMMIGCRGLGGQGGVEAHVDHLVTQLDRAGLRIEVVARAPFVRNDVRTRGERTTIKPLWSPKRQGLEALLHSLVASVYAGVVRPRIVHVHAIGPSIVVPLLRLFGLKVVTTHHGEDYKRDKWGSMVRALLRLGEVCQARLAHARICVGRALSEQLSEQYGVSFHYLPNGVLSPHLSESANELTAFGVEPGKYILSVSRLVPEKRHLDLIDAFEKLGRKDLKLLLAGDADHRTPYSDEVKRRAAANPAVIAPGYLSGPTLYQLYANAAVFCLPSSHEGLPIALLEAMSYGRRVVVSDIVPNLALSLPAESYHRVGDSTDLAEKISKILDGPQPDWSDHLAEFNWQAIAERTVAIYRSVVPLNLKVARHSTAL